MRRATGGGAFQTREERRFSSTAGTRIWRQSCRTLALNCISLFPTGTLRASFGLRLGSPMMCSRLRSGGGPDPPPRRAMDHEEHSSPTHTAQTSPARIQPLMSLWLDLRVRSYSSPWHRSHSKAGMPLSPSVCRHARAQRPVPLKSSRATCPRGARAAAAGRPLRGAVQSGSGTASRARGRPRTGGPGPG